MEFVMANLRHRIVRTVPYTDLAQLQTKDYYIFLTNLYVVMQYALESKIRFSECTINNHYQYYEKDIDNMAYDLLGD